MAQLETSTVQGTCASGFEAVRDAFERNFEERGEAGAAVSVTVDGRAVVDLWGGVADPDTGRPWERDTLVVAWSQTKGVAALAAHMLIERGLLDLDASVARYWPDFAAGGKGEVTVRQVLAHQAGLPALRDPLPEGAFYDWELMTSRLAAETPFWQPGTRNGYHAFTFGYLVGELVRRVTGQSIGHFVRDEIARPLDIEFYIGMPEEHEPRTAKIIPATPPADMSLLGPFEIAAFTDPTSIPALIFNCGGLINPGECDSRAAHAAEMPSAGGITNARSTARLYGVLATGGGGIIGERVLRRAASVASASGVDATLGLPTRFGLGFCKAVDNRGVSQAPNNSVLISEDAFGHPGMGGSISFADPALGMSFGYTMNRQGIGAGTSDRCQALVDATYQAMGYTTNELGLWMP